MRIIAYHGTNETAKESILKTGFKCSEEDSGKIGRRGFGAYFWKAIPGHEDVCERLAFGFVHRNSSFENCVAWCIKVEIKVEDDKFLDFNDEFLKGKVLSFCNRFRKRDRDFAGKVYNLVLGEMEKELGFRILAYEVSVTPPKSCYFPIDLIGMPNCIVVRDKSLIEIITCKSEEN
ncbi:MAG: hypothetical protein K2N58_07825 [Treponemataceae bacterium]|nr:hypothetical protein [Treponemataceae bacterium]